MSIPIEELRQAILRSGFRPTWITPSRGPDGQVKVTISAVYDPDQMIPQPAAGMIAVEDLANVQGVGPKLLDRIREYADFLHLPNGDT